jgi:predicted nucleic acid-binding protein
VRPWDSSALVPLLSDEEKTEVVQALFRDDRNIVTAFITPVELISAVCRKAGVNRDLRRQAMLRYSVLQANWTLVDDYEQLMVLARSIAAQRCLRTGDAIQLACAIRARPDKSLPFVTLDEELIDAARSEGFPVLP